MTPLRGLSALATGRDSLSGIGQRKPYALPRPGRMNAAVRGNDVSPSPRLPAYQRQPGCRLGNTAKRRAWAAASLGKIVETRVPNSD